MGWTSVEFTEFGHMDWTKTEMVSFLYFEYNTDGYEILKTHIHRAKDRFDHNEAYMVMRHPEGYNFLMVVLIDVIGKNIYWKEMSEDMGPGYINCPIEFLSMLPKTDNKITIEWRRMVKEENIQWADCEQ